MWARAFGGNLFFFLCVCVCGVCMWYVCVCVSVVWGVCMVCVHVWLVCIFGVWVVWYVHSVCVCVCVCLGSACDVCLVWGLYVVCVYVVCLGCVWGMFWGVCMCVYV